MKNEFNEFNRYIFTFTKTGDTLKSYDLACSLFSEVVLMPVPCQISKSCGLAIYIKEIDDDRQLRFFDSLTVSSFLYVLRMYSDENGVNHIRKVLLIKENCLK